MKRLASTLPNMLLSLTLVTAGAGALLGWIYSMTKDPIAEAKEKAQVAAIQAVAPSFDNNPDSDKWEYEKDGRQYTVYPAYKDGQFVGAAVKTLSLSGFAGEITVMAGFEADGTLRNYEVLSHAETPGLGSKMETWFRDPTAARSVIGKNPGEVNFYVTKDTEHHGEIDAITAATISSRAFLESLRSAYEAFLAYKENHQ